MAEDSATQMVEVIWPLSVVPCRSEAGSERSVLPLRTYIEETLRRSRTSYSTLQVALYYLVLIKPFVPKNDFTMEQEFDCPASRALMCGRRMFLAALILASKYLQDRNYSAKAWSKMSGLKINEINTNERTFLSKVCWNLHIPEPIFKRWTDVVLKYTPGSHPPSPGEPTTGLSWKSIIHILTPELEKVPLPEAKEEQRLRCTDNYGFVSPTAPTPRPSALHLPQLDSESQQSTPTPATALPRFLEPTPDIAPPTPALARMGPLPTPQLTPSTVGSSTPAASACSSRRPSICSAMALVTKAGLNRCTLDQYPSATLPSIDRFQPPSRRPSISTASSVSSPESMISDRTRSSRASSISSISTVSTNASLAPNNRGCLARQATCRNVGKWSQLSAAAVKEDEKEGTATKPILIADDTEMLMTMSSSPEPVDFTPSDKALHAPHRHSKNAPHHNNHHLPAPHTDKGRKRARPRGGRRSDLQDEIRFQLADELDELMVHMDVDSDHPHHDDHDGDDDILPSPAAEYAARMLSRDRYAGAARKEAQPPVPLLSSARRESLPLPRIPMQKFEGKKRACCSGRGMAIQSSQASAAAGALWGEVS